MKNLTLQQSALLELIKLGIGTSDGSFDFSRLSPRDWDMVMNESKEQSMNVLCFDATKNISVKIPDDTYNVWFLSCAKVMSQNIKILKAQSELTNLLNDNNIPYVILKGASSATFYPDFDKRAFGDIDFIVDSDFLNKTDKLLIENGYKKLERMDTIHYTYYHKTIKVELHFKISGVPDGKSGEILNSCLCNITDNASVVVKPYRFNRPDNSFHGIVILLHILHHILSKGIGLRQICDWACFVQKTHQDDFWIKSLIPTIKAAGLLKFLYIVTDMSVRYFGVNKPSWLIDIPEELSGEFIDEIFRLGNFGRKDKSGSSGLMFTKDSEKQTLSRKIKALINALNKTNHYCYPVLDKAPWLYPFIMLWRMIRYLFLMLLGKRQSLIAASKYADEKSKLISKFELYKDMEE